MNDDGQFCFLRERHLVAKDALLHVARRMIIEVVETNLAPRDDFGMLRQPCQLIQMLLRHFLRFMGMNPYSRVNPIMLFGERQRCIQLLGPRPRADSEQCRNTRSPRAIEHGIAVLRELRKINVRV